MNDFLAAIKGAILTIIIFISIIFAPIYLPLLGKMLILIGMFVGITYNYSHALFVIITSILSVLIGVKVYLEERKK